MSVEKADKILPLRVLLFENSEADGGGLLGMLESPQADICFETLVVNSPGLVEKQMATTPFDILLYSLNVVEDASLSHIEKTATQFPEVSLIVLAAVDAPQNAREVMQRGAQDYLVKGQTGQALLIRAMTHAVELKRAARLLEISETKYRGLFEHSCDAIFLADVKTGTLLDANPAAARLMGVPLEEIIGKHHSWLHPSADQKIYEQLFADYTRNVNTHIEVQIQRPDGEQVPTELTAILVRLPSGPVLFSHFRDISERREAEHSLRLFRELINQSNDAVFVVKPDTARLLDVNIKASELLGYSRSELLNMQATDINILSRTQSAWQSHVANLRSQGSTLAECRYRGKDGRIIPVEVSAKLVHHEDGEYIIAAARDIRERMQAAEEICALAKFPEESPNAVLRVAASGIIAYCNPASQPMLAQWQVQRHDPLPERFAEIIAKTKTTKTPQHMEEEYDNCVYSLMFTATRGADYVDIYGSDITGHRELEKQVRQADKMRAIGELAGGVAHDFNNQLAPIMGYAQLIEARVKDNPDIVKYARTIMKSSGRAAELTRQLLAFARRAKFQTQAVNIHKLISDVIALLERSISRNITMHADLAAPCCTVKGDPAQLESCLLNVALNARDAMPEGGNLSFRTRIGHISRTQSRMISKDLEPGNYLQIEIIDEGVGIPEDIMDHIFDPFFTTKDIGEGTGMGLAAVYGTIQQHAGAIEVESEVGRGTNMRIYLPLAKQNDEATKTQNLGELVHGSGHVLVVDDEADIRQLASDILQMLGYDVSTAANGADAVEQYRRDWQNIDLVIVDMSMPELNGKDAFLKMKEINPDIKAIIASGFGHNGDMNAAIEAGVAAIVRKPYRIEDISQVIHQALTPNNP